MINELIVNDLIISVVGLLNNELSGYATPSATDAVGTKSRAQVVPLGYYTGRSGSATRISAHLALN